MTACTTKPAVATMVAPTIRFSLDRGRKKRRSPKIWESPTALLTGETGRSVGCMTGQIALGFGLPANQHRGHLVLVDQPPVRGLLEHHLQRLSGGVDNPRHSAPIEDSQVVRPEDRDRLVLVEEGVAHD